MEWFSPEVEKDGAIQGLEWQGFSRTFPKVVYQPRKQKEPRESEEWRKDGSSTWHKQNNWGDCLRSRRLSRLNIHMSIFRDPNVFFFQVRPRTCGNLKRFLICKAARAIGHCNYDKVTLSSAHAHFLVWIGRDWYTQAAPFSCGQGPSQYVANQPSVPSPSPLQQPSSAYHHSLPSHQLLFALPLSLHPLSSLHYTPFSLAISHSLSYFCRCYPLLSLFNTENHQCNPLYSILHPHPFFVDKHAWIDPPLQNNQHLVSNGSLCQHPLHLQCIMSPPVQSKPQWACRLPAALYSALLLPP